jgi:hypothetical protein
VQQAPRPVLQRAMLGQASPHPKRSIRVGAGHGLIRRRHC